MEYKRYSYGDWQLRVWKLQLNWTAYAKDYPTLPYGLRIWFNGVCVVDNWFGSKSAK